MQSVIPLDLSEGKKLFLYKYQVVSHNVPFWPELSVKRLLGSVLSDNALKAYFNSEYKTNKLPERDYFWGIIFSVKPTYAKQIIKEAIKERNQLDASANGAESSQLINVIALILQKMLDTPHWTSKS